MQVKGRQWGKPGHDHRPGLRMGVVSAAGVQRNDCPARVHAVIDAA
jgi:hypothetical protein